MAWKAGLIEKNNHRYMTGKASPNLADGRVKAAGKAERYGPVWVVLREYGGLGLAAPPAVRSAAADLTKGKGRISDGIGILF